MGPAWVEGTLIAGSAASPTGGDAFLGLLSGASLVNTFASAPAS
jgi:hypothetical protein